MPRDQNMPLHTVLFNLENTVWDGVVCLEAAKLVKQSVQTSLEVSWVQRLTRDSV